MDARGARWAGEDPLGSLDSLEVDRFEGHTFGATRAGAPPASQAYFHGYAVTTLWPGEEVRALLPDPLEPAPNPALAGRHPVLFLFGEQRRGAVIYGGVTIPSALVYQEFTMAVPFARHRERGSLHVHLPRMVSSFRPAVLTGNWVYGFEKRMGRMEQEGPVVSVRDEGGASLFRARTAPGPRGDAGAARRFDTLRRWFELPVTGIREDGRWVSSYWRFDVTAARLRAADAQVHVHPDLVRGRAGGPCATVPGGVFSIDGMRWALSWPSTPRF